MGLLGSIVAVSVDVRRIIPISIVPTAVQRWMVMGMLKKIIQIIDSSRTYVANKENLANDLIANGVAIPVLCKNCKYYVPLQGTYVCECCEGLNFASDNDFCSYGERKDK